MDAAAVEAPPAVIAEEIGRALADAELVDECLEQVRTVAAYPTGWDSRSIAMGPLGSALVFEALATPADGGDEWTRRSDAILDACYDGVVDGIDEHDSLFGGAQGALLAYLTAAARDERRWLDRAGMLAEEIADQMLSIEPIPADGDVADSDYDLISGRAGGLMALAAARRALPGSPSLRAAENRLFDDLHEMLRRGARIGDGACIAPQHYPLPEYAAEFPDGYLNLGAAHGMPGILIALSGCALDGARLELRNRAIRDLATRVQEAASWDEFGSTWSTGIAMPSGSVARAAHAELAPNAWCYGAPGVALALSHAASALSDQELRDSAEETMLGAVARHRRRPALGSPTICHGLAGIVACADAVLGDGSTSGELPHAPLIADLVARASPDAPLLYRDFEEPAQLLDNPTVIQGAAGVALVLAGRGAGAARAPWRSLFGFC